MQIKLLLKQELGKEYPELSRNVIRAVVWHITGGVGETFEQVYNSIVEDAEISAMPPELKDKVVYKTLLVFGRECCQNSALIQKFRDTIIQIRLEIKIENQEKFSNARLITKYSPLVSDVENRKRKVDFEDEKDTSLKQGNTNS